MFILTGPQATAPTSQREEEGAEGREKNSPENREMIKTTKGSDRKRTRGGIIGRRGIHWGKS